MVYVDLTIGQRGFKNQDRKNDKDFSHKTQMLICKNTLIKNRRNQQIDILKTFYHLKSFRLYQPNA